jgi:hypothetical protein
LKLRSTAKQAVEARMWRCTPAQLRNSLLFERWLVAVDSVLNWHSLSASYCACTG